jgi:hypothetical protein
MQALKALVFFLGILIVVMMGAVAYGIVVKFGGVMDSRDAAGPTAPAGGPVAAKAWDKNLRVAVPAGARVSETVVAGGRMIVRLVLPDDSQRYLVFDLESGAQLGMIDLEPEAQ